MPLDVSLFGKECIGTGREAEGRSWRAASFSLPPPASVRFLSFPALPPLPLSCDAQVSHDCKSMAAAASQSVSRATVPRLGVAGNCVSLCHPWHTRTRSRLSEFVKETFVTVPRRAESLARWLLVDSDASAASASRPSAMLVRRLAASSGHQPFSDEVAGATLLKHLGAREQDKHRASFSVKLEFFRHPENGHSSGWTYNKTIFKDKIFLWGNPRRVFWESGVCEKNDRQYFVAACELSPAPQFQCCVWCRRRSRRCEKNDRFCK